MSVVISLASGEALDEPIPASDTPVAVLEQLLADIRSGALDCSHLVVVMQTGRPGLNAGFMSRASRMTIAEVIALLAITQRNVINNILT